MSELCKDCTMLTRDCVNGCPCGNEHEDCILLIKHRRQDARIKELEDALGKYANWANWKSDLTFDLYDYEEVEFYCGNYGIKKEKVGGKLARKVLNKEKL